eukprot:COSAG01_NODE_19959_length_979_cov_4.631818_1_plen_78_part_00
MAVGGNRRWPLAQLLSRLTEQCSSMLFELGEKGATGGRLIGTGLNLWQAFNSTMLGGFEAPEKAYLLWKLLEHGFSS